LMSGMVCFDITPDTDGMLSYVTFSIYVALLFNIVILSTANSAVSSVDSIAQESKRKLDRVTNYLRFQGINPLLRNQITEFYKHALSSSSTKESQALTNELPSTLAAQLILDTHRPLIARCALFHVVNNTTILALLNKLQPGTIPPKMYVMREGMSIGALYFIIRGLVQLKSGSAIFGGTSDDNHGLNDNISSSKSRRSSADVDTARHDKVITDHAFFGDHAMIDESAHAKFTAYSLSYVNLVLLQREDFELVADVYEQGGAEGVRVRWKERNDENKRCSSSSTSATLQSAGSAVSKVAMLKTLYRSQARATNTNRSTVNAGGESCRSESLPQSKELPTPGKPDLDA